MKVENVISKLQRLPKFELPVKTLQELASRSNCFVYCYDHLMVNLTIGMITSVKAWENGLAADPNCEVIVVKAAVQDLVLKYTNRKDMEVKMIV